MPSRKGVWLPLDCGFPDDDKVIEAGERPAYLFILMSLAAKRLATDGVLTRAQVSRLHVAGWESRLVRLLEVGLVHELEPERYTIAAWFQHNEPVSVVNARKEQEAERKRVSRRTSSGRPADVRPPSDRSPDVEKRRGEKKREATPTAAALALRAAPPDVFKEAREHLSARKAAGQ